VQSRRSFAGLLAAIPVTARAAWPERAVRVIVPFAAGGNTDVMARAVMVVVSDALGKPFVIENRIGGGGTLGAETAARAAPDGYTLLAGSGGSLTANPVMQANLAYDPLRDFAPIGLLARVPNVLILAPGRREQRWPEFLAVAKATPGGLSIASPAIGTTAHFGLELLNHATGAGLVHVPYRGGSSLVADLLAGNFDGAIVELTTALPLHQEGKARILAIAAEQRVPQLPEVPTFIEDGVAGFTATSFTALLAPAGTPASLITTLRDAAVQALTTPVVMQRFAGLGATPATAAECSPEGLTRYLVAELARYREAAALAGLRPL
jgi:tripartite-type tricarboxylate transporter receptor subunit TctC